MKSLNTISLPIMISDKPAYLDVADTLNGKLRARFMLYDPEAPVPGDTEPMESYISVQEFDALLEQPINGAARTETPATITVGLSTIPVILVNMVATQRFEDNIGVFNIEAILSDDKTRSYGYAELMKIYEDLLNQGNTENSATAEEAKPRRITVYNGIMPNFNRLLILPKEAITKTKSGIIIPDTATEVPAEGTIVAVGPRVVEWFNGGEKVAYSKYAGSDYERNGITYKVLRDDDVLALLAD